MSREKLLSGHATPRALVAVALILVLVVGAAFWLSRRVTPPHSGSTAPPSRTANVIAETPDPQPQIRILEDSPSRIRYAITLQDGVTVERFVAFDTHPAFQPTGEEVAAGISSDRRVYGARLTRIDGPSADQLVLEYVVPTSALPPELRYRLFDEAGPDAAGLHLFSIAWAGAAGGLWTGIKSGYSNFKMIDKNLVKNLKSASDRSDQSQQWLQKLDLIESCARHPTHLVTQNEYARNPAYQAETLAAIADARSEVGQTIAVSYLNQATTVAASGVTVSAPGEGLVAKGLGKAGSWLWSKSGSVSKWNEAAINEIAQRQLNDIAKLVDCDLARPPPRTHGDGTILYEFDAAGMWGYDELKGYLNGTFDIGPAAPGLGSEYVDLSGDGAFRYKAHSPEGGASCEGVGKISGGGYSGDLQIEGVPTEGSCIPSTLDAPHVPVAFTCNFHNVDLVNGGKYSAVPTGDFSERATCELKLTPQQR